MRRNNNNRHYEVEQPLDERIFEYNNLNTNFNFVRAHTRSPSVSPLRDISHLKINSSSSNRNGYSDRYDVSPARESYHHKPSIHVNKHSGYLDRYESPLREVHNYSKGAKYASILDRFESPSRDHRQSNRYSSYLERVESPVREVHQRGGNNNKYVSILDRFESPVRDSVGHFRPNRNSSNNNNERFESPPPEQDEILKLKWLDYSPRMSKLREHKNKRLSSRLEQFELWDLEQEQKQKQYELAREQRYNNIMDRLKTQDFCLNQMRRRHESDIEATRDLETYAKEHLFIEALEDPKERQRGPISEYRRFEAEMDHKLRTLEDEIDQVNPRFRIEQAIIPRLERTRELYSQEPEIYTARGKKLLKRPSATPNRGDGRISEERESVGRYEYYDAEKGVKYYYPVAVHDSELFTERIRMEIDSMNRKKPKPIIRSSEEHEESVDGGNSQSKVKVASSSERRVNFKDEDIKEVAEEVKEEVKEVVEEAKSVVSEEKKVDDDLASEMVVKSEAVTENTEAPAASEPAPAASENEVSGKVEVKQEPKSEEPKKVEKKKADAKKA